jgi:flavin reductase (DIM6/NTAB) family NADH-FMN oxidoreductase RutF
LSVDADTFRAALASVCTPVAVVTSRYEERAHGTTVSAFCSLSLDPPLVGVALDRDSELLAMVVRAGEYAINVLGDGQEELAALFARKGVDKFARVDHELDDGLPRLPGATSWLACDLEQLVPAGDHVMAVGLVRRAETRGGDPLLYRHRRFGTLSARLSGDRALSRKRLY